MEGAGGRRVIYTAVASRHPARTRPAFLNTGAREEAEIKYLDEEDEEEEEALRNQQQQQQQQQHVHEFLETDLDSNRSNNASTNITALNSVNANSNSNRQRRRQQLQEELRRSPEFQRCRSQPHDVISSFGEASLELKEPEPDYPSSERADEASEDRTSTSVEEVYLCNCCGVTRELSPAMKYMPLFKSLFALFNLLALLFGLADLVMGLWFRVDPKVYEIHHYIETQNFTIAGWILLIGGALACMIALLIGFSASSRQSVCLLMFYTILMALLSIIFIGTLVLLTVYGLGNSLERFLTKEIYEQIRRRSMGSEPFDMLISSDATQFLDFVQVKLRCCGAQDFRDYQKLGLVIPTTCYTIAGNFINAPGCGQALREIMDIRAGLATGFAAASVISQLLACLLAGLMVCSIYNYRARPRPASILSNSMRSRPRLGGVGNNSPC